MQAARQARHIAAVPATRPLQCLEDDVDVGPDPFGRRGGLALGPQIVRVLDERRAQPQADLVRIRPERQPRRESGNGSVLLGGANPWLLLRLGFPLSRQPLRLCDLSGRQFRGNFVAVPYSLLAALFFRSSEP